jgi:hypothetical protein
LRIPIITYPLLPDLFPVLTVQWFNIFNILFEVVSAYGGVGLSIVFPLSKRCPDARDIPPPMQRFHLNSML